MLKLRRDETGFTLIELLIAIVILGIIAVPLGNTMIGYLHNTDATAGRFTESHDIQIATAYFAEDVASIGVRDFTSTSAPLLQSVEVNAPVAGGLYPCGAAGTPDAVVRFASTDPPTDPSATPVQRRVAYVIETSAGQSSLHRITCSNSATPTTPTSDSILAHDLVTAMVTCTPAPCTSSGSALPKRIDLSLTVHDTASAPGSYTATLSGQRRQT
jgi:prepilin-type N-terminal cleavage/methylation domain-containing protein